MVAPARCVRLVCLGLLAAPVTPIRAIAGSDIGWAVDFNNAVPDFSPNPPQSPTTLAPCRACIQLDVDPFVRETGCFEAGFAVGSTRGMFWAVDRERK